MIRIRFAPALLLLLAVLAAACSDPAADPAADRSATSPGGGTSPPQEDRDCQDLDPSSFAGDSVEPGRWCVQALGAADAPYAALEVPAGYVSWGGSLEQAHDPYTLLSYWTVESVYEDPCTRAGGPVDPGPSVRDLAGALGREKITETTEPVPVTIDGHEGLYLELTFPTEMDFTPCLERELYVWEADDQMGARWEDILGVVDSYWILDVDGRRVVLVASRDPQLSTSRLAKLKGVVESARFLDQT